MIAVVIEEHASASALKCQDNVFNQKANSSNQQVHDRLVVRENNTTIMIIMIIVIIIIIIIIVIMILIIIIMMIIIIMKIKILLLLLLIIIIIIIILILLIIIIIIIIIDISPFPPVMFKGALKNSRWTYVYASMLSPVSHQVQNSYFIQRLFMLG